MISREKICSIENLEKYIRTLIPVSITALGYEDYEITDIEFEDMVNQVIMNILFDKYIKEEELVSSFKYSKELNEILHNINDIDIESQFEYDDLIDVEKIESNQLMKKHLDLLEITIVQIIKKMNGILKS